MLPTHNRADVLRVAIASALAQTEPDFELIVVGDGCTDNTIDVVRGANDPRVRWLDLPKTPGFGYTNRNIALHSARADTIAYLQHDDIWFPDHLELLVGRLDATGADIVFGRTLDVSTQGFAGPVGFNPENPDVLDAWLAHGVGFVTTSSVAHRTSCLTRFGYWDESLAFGGDWELWARIIEGGQRRNIAHEPTPAVLKFVNNWRRRPWVRDAWHWIRWHMHALDGLRFTAPPGTTLQKAAWRQLNSGSPGGFQRARAAAQILMDDEGRSRLKLHAALDWVNDQRKRLRNRSSIANIKTWA